MARYDGSKAGSTSKDVSFGAEGWDHVNRELRHHGLMPLETINSAKVEDLQDKVVLTEESSLQLLKNLASLLRDCDRRQDLIRDLITSNSALRNELKEQTSTTNKYETLARDLRVMLNASQDKVEELESSIMNLSNMSSQEDERSRRSTSALEEKCGQLTHLCSTQDKEIKLLQGRLKTVNDENSKRNSQSQKIFAELKKSSRLINNEAVLGMIDSYERKLHNLRRKLNYEKELRIQEDVSDELNDEDIPDYKIIIKAYEKEQKILTKRLKSCENEKEVLELDLQSRPDMEMYKEALHKIKKLERLIKAHKIKENSVKSPVKIGHLNHHFYEEEWMSPDQGLALIKSIQEELNVEDSKDILPELESLVKLRSTTNQLEKFVNDLIKVLHSEEDLLPPDLYNDAPFEKRHLVWCEKTQHRVRQIVHYWHQQLTLLKKLQRVVNKLGKEIVPTKKINLSGPPRCLKIISALENLLRDEDGVTRNEVPLTANGLSKTKLQEVVDHFMKLFSVRKTSGIYPRMNDIYLKLGEVHNVMNTLKDILSLDENENNNIVIETVAQLSRAQNDTTTDQLQQLLQTDLDSLKARLQEYEEFFPVFREIITRLLDILEVNRLDQVVPKVQSLKLLTQQ